MTKNEEMAKEYEENAEYVEIDDYGHKVYGSLDIERAYLAGLKVGRLQWHKIFNGEPWCVEYWDLPQDNLPKIENFYFVRLKNGYIKVCELKYDSWSRKKFFYDLHGGKQSDVAEWLDYPTAQEE